MRMNMEAGKCFFKNRTIIHLTMCVWLLLKEKQIDVGTQSKTLSLIANASRLYW